MKPDPYLTLQKSTQQIKDLNWRHEKIKPLEEKLYNIGLGNDFWVTTQSTGNNTNNNRQEKWHQTKQLLQTKNQQSEMAMKGMKENICKPHPK